MRINKLMSFGAILATLLFAGLVFAAGHEKPAEEAATKAQQSQDVKKVPKAEHEKAYPYGHGDPLPGKRCMFDEKEAIYICNY